VGRDCAAILAGTGATLSSSELKLVHPNSSKFIMIIILSKKQKERSKNIQEWHRFATMGSQQDEYTSTSSHFKRQGVMLQQEVTIKVQRSHMRE